MYHNYKHQIRLMTVKHYQFIEVCVTRFVYIVYWLLPFVIFKVFMHTKHISCLLIVQTRTRNLDSWFEYSRSSREFFLVLFKISNRKVLCVDAANWLS